MRQSGLFTHTLTSGDRDGSSANPKLTHGAEMQTNHPVEALVARRSQIVSMSPPSQSGFRIITGTGLSVSNRTPTVMEGIHSNDFSATGL